MSVGLIMEGKISGFRDVTVAGCGECPSCRDYERRLDGWRIREAAGPQDFGLAVIPDEQWPAVKQRFARAGILYHQTPIGNDRRAVIVPADAPIPNSPVDDLEATLAALEKQRNRIGDKRRISSSGLRSREETEALAYDRADEEGPDEERSIVGFFRPKAVSDSDDLLEIAQSLEAAANAIGIDVTRKGLVIAVDGNRYGPKLHELWDRLGVSWVKKAIRWRMGSPPPAPPVWEDVPITAYREAM